MLVYMLSTSYSCQILIKLEFSRYIFEKFLKVKFYENSSVKDELLHADGPTDMAKLIDYFCNFANPSKQGLK
jgi:hypothetical protein